MGRARMGLSDRIRRAGTRGKAEERENRVIYRGVMVLFTEDERVQPLHRVLTALCAFQETFGAPQKKESWRRRTGPFN